MHHNWNEGERELLLCGCVCAFADPNRFCHPTAGFSAGLIDKCTASGSFHFAPMHSANMSLLSSHLIETSTATRPSRQRDMPTRTGDRCG